MPEKKYVVPEHDEVRFWKLVQKLEGCWNWIGGKINGYGTFQISMVNYRAHRLSYALSRGEVPCGLDLDHLCRNRGYVNPSHLKPVTKKENIARGDSPAARVHRTNVCSRGHDLTAHGYTKSNGKRFCRICRNQWDRDRRRSAG